MAVWQAPPHHTRTSGSRGSRLHPCRLMLVVLCLLLCCLLLCLWLFQHQRHPLQHPHRLHHLQQRQQYSLLQMQSPSRRQQCLAHQQQHRAAVVVVTEMRTKMTSTTSCTCWECDSATTA